jgi:hypothetical protein
MLAGCDPFSTKSFTPKPGEVASFQGPSRAGDSISFRVTESLWNAESNSSAGQLARKRVTFIFKGDTAVGGDTLRAYSMLVTDEASHALIEQSLRMLRVGADGLELRLPGNGGGARFFPMKIAASAADSAAFRALPPLFAAGMDWSSPMGSLNVTRSVEGTDTLDAGGGLEEAWRVAETVFDQGRTLARGRYWYGASGLLKAEQTWDEFDWRDDTGGVAGKAGLRRDLERL